MKLEVTTLLSTVAVFSILIILAVVVRLLVVHLYYAQYNFHQERKFYTLLRLTATRVYFHHFRNSLCMRPGFFNSCQLWKKRVAPQGLQDIYDGKIWQEFQQIDGHSFLELSTSLVLMLNVDWFQPYKRTVASVGVIYVTVVNLPRCIRFKRENVIILGIIPGPSEPEHDINQFLKPLVDDLLLLWTGVTMKVCAGDRNIAIEKIRCALLCCACDLPAGRKACGFLGCSARLGCSRCLKEFPGTVGDMDYSGFNRSLWKPRTNESHRNDVKKLSECMTKSAKSKCESELGCRFSVLLKLPYFDAPRMLLVDPMHNLFLGTAKKMISIWLQHETLSSGDFLSFQSLVDSFCVPTDIGRIPRKIATAFAGFTADQYKNWVTLYSIPCLFGVLPSPHLECWRHFVLACRLICKYNLSQTDITLLDALLMHFCQKVEVLYGPSVITPNMHMHGHLKEVVLDFGPVSEFWLFSFERYNGILGNQPSNNRAIEPQLLRRFLKDNFAYSFEFPDQLKEHFQELIPHERITGSCKHTCTTDNALEYVLPSKCSLGVFDPDEVAQLTLVYSKLQQCSLEEIRINSVHRKYSTITIGSYTYHSTGKRFSKPCIAMAQWDTEMFGQSPTVLPDSEHPTSNVRPVNIHYFLKVSIEHSVNFNSDLVLARVSWHSPHPNRHIIGKPAEVWCPNLYEPFGTHSFIPLKYIQRSCVYCNKIVNGENVLVIVPLV